ncbi:chymotrypsin-like protease ctrl-1 [Plakobranchus ocellatus]|uniref:Chymotrypsin-like protease ctrl-1 n=1 Tax=Plakobranchus ocellatus TaxID=259542 RepID=A0AAV3ZFB2_9GAST|nr:chymotrypsin-like protease ctrl-1 [Plakobranchus ocellatus]
MANDLLLSICVTLALSVITVLGEDGVETRIIGGVEVWDRCRPPFSWMVALRMQSPEGPVTFCSSVMLDNTTLVTSGRCIFQFVTTNTSPGVAVVGERDLLGRDNEEQTIPIEGIRVHPEYNSDTYDNNIGLVRLSYPARLSRCVKPAHKMEDDPEACLDLDTSCLMAGWGPFAETSEPTNSRVLRSAPVTVYGDFVTLQLELTRTQNAQPEGALYAEAMNPRQKACFFDWGGVVSCQRNGNTVLRGVIGEHNCNSNPTPPVMVTNVPEFEQWVEACQRNWNSFTCTGQAPQ